MGHGGCNFADLRQSVQFKRFSLSSVHRRKYPRNHQAHLFIIFKIFDRVIGDSENSMIEHFLRNFPPGLQPSHGCSFSEK